MTDVVSERWSSYPFRPLPRGNVTLEILSDAEGLA